MKGKLTKVTENEENMNLLLYCSVLVLLTRKKHPHSTEKKFKTSKKISKFQQK